MTHISTEASKPQNTELTLFKTLITAQTTLDTLVSSDSDFISEHKTVVNDAITSYNTTEGAFVTFVDAGATGDSGALVQQSAQLTATIIQLISQLTKPMDEKKASEMKFEHHAAKPEMSLESILTYLKIAADVAEGIPGASPWATLAELVLSTVGKAVSAHSSASKVDLAQLHQIALIS